LTIRHFVDVYNLTTDVKMKNKISIMQTALEKIFLIKNKIKILNSFKKNNEALCRKMK